MMPIRPENKARYSSQWAEIRERIRTRAGNRCEWCGVANHTVGYRTAEGEFVALDDGVNAANIGKIEITEHVAEAMTAGRRLIRIVCTTAHVTDKRPEADSDDNLAFLCQRCHNRHDAADRQRGRRQRREAAAGVQHLFDQ